MGDTEHSKGDAAPPSSDIPRLSGKALRGVTLDWFGPYDEFCELLSISRGVQKRLRKVLAKDDGFIEINIQNVFVTAEAGFRGLKILREGGDGVAVSRRPSGRKGR